MPTDESHKPQLFLDNDRRELQPGAGLKLSVVSCLDGIKKYPEMLISRSEDFFGSRKTLQDNSSSRARLGRWGRNFSLQMKAATASTAR